MESEKIYYRFSKYFGVSRPSLSRVIGDFIDEELLERVDKDTFKIIDKESLLEKV